MHFPQTSFPKQMRNVNEFKSYVKNISKFYCAYSFVRYSTCRVDSNLANIVSKVENILIFKIFSINLSIH